MMLAVAVMMVATLGGCQETSSSLALTLNQQRSLLRATADNALTAYLDRTEDLETLERRRLRAHGIAHQVKMFLKDGSVAELTRDELRAQLLRMVPSDYQLILDHLLAAVSSVHVDTAERIGENNVKRLASVCDGTTQATMQYIFEDR